MKALGCMMALTLVVLAAAPANAMNWSLGANLGFHVVAPTDKDIDNDGTDDFKNTSGFSWPSSALPVPTASQVVGVMPIPGLRIGFTGETPTHELYIDTGLQYTSSKDLFTDRSFVATANYQYNFGSGGSMSPFATAGGGFVMVATKDDSDPTSVVDLSASGAMYGAGVGIRHKMGNGHSTVRAEARFDRTTDAKDKGTDLILIPEANVISLKLGFDFWDK